MRRLFALLGPILLAIVGAGIGLQLVPASTVQVGPLTTTVHLRPSLEPRTVLKLPPVGEVEFETHRAPVTIEARVQGVDLRQAQQLLASPSAMTDLEKTAPEALTSGIIQNAGLCALFALGGAAISVGLTYRRVRRSVIAAGSALAVTAASVGLMAATFRPQALYQPRFDGLLSQAPYVADIGRSTMADYASYRTALAQFVSQVSSVYAAASAIPDDRVGTDVVRVLHVSDIHDNPQAFDVIAKLVSQLDVDLVVDTGDITSWGMPAENRLLEPIGDLDVPYVFVGGNHDGRSAIEAVAEKKNAHVLNNEVIEVEGLRIAGIGDPRFTPDDDASAEGKKAGSIAVEQAGYQLGATITEYDAAHPDAPVDIALFHDPTVPGGLEGRVPLVLSGHMHAGNVQLDRDGSGTDWLTVGSTGGALTSGGTNAVLEGGEPVDLSARLLYLDRSTHRLLAYDDIAMGGLGLVSVSIQRHTMPTEQAPLTVPSSSTAPAEPMPAERSVAPGTVPADESRVTTTPTPTEAATTDGADGTGTDGAGTGGAAASTSGTASPTP